MNNVIIKPVLGHNLVQDGWLNLESTGISNSTDKWLRSSLVRTQHVHHCSPGSIPGVGTESPHQSPCSHSLSKTTHQDEHPMLFLILGPGPLGPRIKTRRVSNDTGQPKAFHRSERFTSKQEFHKVLSDWGWGSPRHFHRKFAPFVRVSATSCQFHARVWVCVCVCPCAHGLCCSSASKNHPHLAPAAHSHPRPVLGSEKIQ